MSTTQTTTTAPRPASQAELHGLPLVAHVEALLALTPDPKLEISEP